MKDVTQKVAAAVHEARDKALRSLLNECLGEEGWSLDEVPSKGLLREIPTPQPMDIGGWKYLHYSTTLVSWEGKPLGFFFVKVRTRSNEINMRYWFFQYR